MTTYDQNREFARALEDLNDALAKSYREEKEHEQLKGCIRCLNS